MSILCALALLCGCARSVQPVVPDDASVDMGSDMQLESTARVLVFTRTLGFRHESIADGLVMLRAIATSHSWALDESESAADFTDDNLARYDAVVWLSTTGDVLDEAQQAAFERYVNAGGGYVGIHAAADCEYDWIWYGELVGAFFDNHPAIQTATLHVEDATHASTFLLPSTWMREDEWYNFRTNPRANVDVLLTLDESTYEGGTMGDDHPIAWLHEVGEGRAFYTALGHTSESYADPPFIAHITGAIEWAVAP